jgi:WD40 repeat protein
MTAVAISPDNRWVVTGGPFEDNAARLWDLNAKDPAANSVVLLGHEGAVRAVATSPDNRWVVTGSNDGTARVWDLRAKDPAANPIVLLGHDEAVVAVLRWRSARITTGLSPAARTTQRACGSFK